MLREIKTFKKHYYVDENDLIQGEYQEYWCTGQLREHSFYVNGNRHGEYKDYFYNGRLRVLTFLVNGKIHGEYYWHNIDGFLKRSTYYYHGTDLNVEPSTLTQKDKMYIAVSGRLPPRD